MHLQLDMKETCVLNKRNYAETCSSYATNATTSYDATATATRYDATTDGTTQCQPQMATQPQPQMGQPQMPQGIMQAQGRMPGVECLQPTVVSWVWMVENNMESVHGSRKKLWILLKIIQRHLQQLSLVNQFGFL